MSGDPEDGSAPLTPQDSWLEVVLNVRIPRGNRSGSGGTAPGGATPASTNTIVFFKHKSADLTDTAKQSLDAYAKAYLDARSSEPIYVDGYASTEGDPKDNQKLSQARADAVAEYLRKKGGKKTTAYTGTSPVADHLRKQGGKIEIEHAGAIDKVLAKGHGATAQFSKDLAQNRRAMIKPPPPPPGKDKSPTLGHKADEIDITTVPIPEPPPEGIPRAQVERVLKDRFEKLAPLQRGIGGDGTKVKVSPKVQTAGKVVSEGLDEHQKNISNLLTGNKQAYDPGVLAKLIADLLPETIPLENFNALLAMRFVEGAEELSDLEMAGEKYRELRDSIANKLPEKLREPAKKLMDKAVEKGGSVLIDKGLEEIDPGQKHIDPKVKEEMENLIKETIKGRKGGSK